MTDNSINYQIGEKIRHIIALFYPPFRKVCSIQFFRYGVSGASNTLFGWVLYCIIYNFVLAKQILDLGFIAFTPHIGAFVIQFPITFISGFWLNRYVSFSESSLRKRVQASRYLTIVLVCIIINYWGLKFFVEIMHIYPTPSQIINTIITTVFSFFTQKHFAFKTKQ